MKTHHLPARGPVSAGRHQLWEEKIHDSYRRSAKLRQPAACTGCGAVYRQGRWVRHPDEDAPAGNTLCPACLRLRDHFPAGYVILHGADLGARRGELLRLIRHEEAGRNGKGGDGSAQARVMAIEEGEGEWLVTTTDTHLARRIGEALHRACRGTLDFRYSPGRNLLRVHWTA
ncbi:BCAM0308 family protein [Oryzomicrobium sp.]|uniref:BCAM0308 family protein n=1 Tax=Oryzomicrobium sp. TaxID=1911578 RepID=UPI002FDF2F77